jgi:hypothetical protein
MPMGRLGAFVRWFDRRRAFRELCREEARNLLALNPHTAYYDAQRIAASARFAGDAQAFIHWARVAAEIARISDDPIDRKIVEQIVDEEERSARMRDRTR